MFGVKMIDYKLLAIVFKNKLDEDVSKEWYIFNVRMEKMDGTIDVTCKHINIDGKFKKVHINYYEYGVYLKEVIEDKAKYLGLKAVWIDLNDLSKDEAYYFRNCNDVYKSLVDFEIKK